jgi:acetyl esterase/lipase
MDGAVAAPSGYLRVRLALAPLLLAGLISYVWLSPVTLLNAAASGDWCVTRDIAYMPGPRGRLDIYTPAGAKDAPVVVFFYGGSWKEGDKAMYRFVGAALAAHGILTIIPDYRVYPEVRFPTFLLDAARAVAWSKKNAQNFGGDPARLVLMGHSAGAYIAAMLALDPAYLGAEGLNPKRDISGVIGLAGPYDFLPLHDPVIKIIFGPPNELARTQPINFVTRGAPPAFLAAGLRDTTVDPQNSVRLAGHLRAAGDNVRERFYPWLDHRLIIGTISPPLGFFAPVLPDCLAFIHDVTGVQTLRKAA